MSDDPQIKVTDDVDEGRFVIRIDGEVAGFAAYRLPEAGVIAFTHTEIDGRFAGRGLAKRLIRDALDDARARGLGVVPICPFVEDFIARNPGYAELVVAR